MTDESIAISCRHHCGLVAVTDPVLISITLRKVQALADGASPLGAISCPNCNEEVLASDVVRRVDPWLANREGAHE